MKLFSKKPVENTILFLHIPKCAGTTLTEEVIKMRFKPDELIIFYDQGPLEIVNRLQGMSKTVQRKIKCIAGHFYFGIHKYFDVRPSTYITLLRDPVERIISHYFLSIAASPTTCTKP